MPLSILKWISRRQPIAEWKQLLLLNLVALGIIYWRNPLFFLLPRVFAEEPGFYLLNALIHPMPYSFGATMAGYFSFVPNFAAELAAKVFPLRFAAHVFTAVGLLIQLTTVTSIYYSAGRIMPSRAYSALSAIFLLVIAKPETWLNTVYSMYWLATGMFYLLNSKYITRFHVAYASLAFLTGPTSLVWLPFFGLRWMIGYAQSQKQEKRIRFIGIIGLIALIINLSLSFVSRARSSIGSRLEPQMIMNLPRGFASMFVHLFASGGYPLPIALVVALVFGVLIGFIYICSDWRFRIFAVVALIYYAFVVAVLSFEMQGGNRYALPITAAIFSLSVLSLSKLFLFGRTGNNKARSILFLTGFLFLLGNRSIEFHDFSGTYAGSNYVYDPSWPNWKVQINAVNRSKGGVIKTFPQWADTELQGGDWSFRLPGGVGR